MSELPDGAIDRLRQVSMSLREGNVPMSVLDAMAQHIESGKELGWLINGIMEGAADTIDAILDGKELEARSMGDIAADLNALGRT